MVFNGTNANFSPLYNHFPINFKKKYKSQHKNYFLLSLIGNADGGSMTYTYPKRNRFKPVLITTVYNNWLNKHILDGKTATN